MKYMHLQLMTSRLITIIKVRLRLKYGWVNDLKPFPFFFVQSKEIFYANCRQHVLCGLEDIA